MKRLAAFVCGTTLAVAALSGCGSDDGSGSESDAAGSSAGGDYCGQIEDAQSEFSDVGADATVDDLATMGDRMSEIADSAPDDVQPSWQNSADALESMVTALEDAGIDTSKTLAEASQDPKAAKALAKVQGDMASLSKDQAAIQKQVKDECDIDMGASSEQQ